MPFSIYFQKKKHASKSEFPPRVQVLWRILQAPPDSLLALLVFSCLLRDSSDVLVPGIWGKWKCLQGSPGHKTLMGCRVTLTHGIDQSAVFRKSLQSPEITFYFKTHSVTLVTHCRVTLGMVSELTISTLEAASLYQTHAGDQHSSEISA